MNYYHLKFVEILINFHKFHEKIMSFNIKLQ